MNTFIMMQLCFQKIEEISQERKDKFLEFLEEVKNALISDFIKKKNEAKDRELNIIELARKIEQKDIKIKEVYELDNAEEQIKFELFKVI